MKLFRKVTGSQGKKAWSQPNFWEVNESLVSWTPAGPNQEYLEHNFQGYVRDLYKDNGVVFACVQTRQLVFSEARFAFQRMRNGAPAKFDTGSSAYKDHDKKKPEEDKPKMIEAAHDYEHFIWDAEACMMKLIKPSPGKKPGKDDKKPKGDGSTRPNDLFGTPALKLLEEPWPGGETGNLLSIMEADASLAGNSYTTITNDEGQYGNAAKGSETARLVRMRPDLVQIVIWSPSGNPWALDARVAGYVYRPPVSYASQPEHVLLLPEEVAHYAPIPDPQARFRGMSWLTPILREIMADRASETHKKKFLDNGATLGHVVSMPPEVGQDDFDAFVKKFRETHEGFNNAYKTLFLGGGADITPVGVDFRQLEFTQTQGHGETRIAAASGVPPVIVGLSEGLQAATYSNYSQARRRFADGTLRPLWRMACAALAKLVDVPSDARLWYDDSDISFLRDDKKEEAEIVETTARAAKALIESGWEPETVTRYLVSRDPADLKHSGLVSVQLLPPGSMNPAMPMGAPGAAGAPGAGKPAAGQAKPAAGGKPASKPAAKPAAKKPAPKAYSLWEEDEYVWEDDQ